MTKLESACVHCGLPCKYEACPYYRVEVHYCDRCKDNTLAVARWDGEDYCESCLIEELEKEFFSLSLKAKIEVLGHEDNIEEV